MDRRSLLVAAGTLSMGSVAGCTDTLFGDGFSEPVGSSELTARKGELVDRYETAVLDRNDGIDRRRQGIEAFNEGAYQRAIGRFETAIGRFEAAAQGFSEALDLAREIGEEEATAICEAAAEETALQLEATEAGLDAAIAERDGSGDVNDHVETYRAKVEAAEAIDVENPQALADVLQSG